MPTLAVDRIGQKFNRLTILDIVGRKNRTAVALCQCDCGKRKQIVVPSLLTGNTKSCGCIAKEWSAGLSKTYLTKHGHSSGGGNTSIYNRWLAIRRRCNNPGNWQFPDYGGRGIKVCPAWNDSFEQFLKDVGEPPFPGATLDRENNNGNYEPGNVRWATRSQQARNRRDTTLSDEKAARIRTLRSERVGPSKIAAEVGVSLRCVEHVIYEGAWA